MKDTSRAIIRIDNDYIFIRREKKINNVFKVFYTTVGGHVENGESFEETCKREVYEELGINVEIEYMFHEDWFEEIDKHEKFYVVKYIDGQLGTGQGEEFINTDIDKYGTYKIVRINKNELANYNILPIGIKEKIIKEINE